MIIPAKPHTQTLRRFVFVLALSLPAACGEPEVTGRVLLPVAPGQFRPAGNVEVLLVKGDLQATLLRMAQEYEARAVAQAATSTLDTLKKRLPQRAAEVESIKASLGVRRKEWDPTSCTAEAEAAANAARASYTTLVDRLTPEMKALGVDTSNREKALAQLRLELSATLEREARRLAEEYMFNQVTARSSVVLNLSPRDPDRLCWSIANKGNLKLLTIDIDVTFNGRHVPVEILKHYWSAPWELRGLAIKVRNSYGQEVRGLAPGANFTECFYASTPNLTSEQRRAAEEFGLPAGGASRSGAWEIAVTGGVLTNAEPVTVTQPGAAAAHVEYPVRPLVEVMAPGLQPVRLNSPQGKLITALVESKEARALQSAEEVLTMCRRVTELEGQENDLAQAIEALEAKKTQDPAARKAINDLVEEIKARSETHSALVARAEQQIESNLVSFQRSAVDGTFGFTEVEKGQYTLVATNKTKMGSSVTWIVPIAVNSSVSQELGKPNAMDGSFPDVLKQIITRPARKPSGKHVPQPAEAKKKDAGTEAAP